MTQKFFITGLPRSRTAWMSAFCTTGKTLCYHEPLSMLHEVSDLGSLYEGSYYSHVGVSDSSLGFFIDQILRDFQPRTLIIDRDIRDVEKSTDALGIPRTNFCELLLERLRAVKNNPLVMWLPFEAMSEKRVMQKAFWHLMPGVEFDEVRYEEMIKLHIETDMAKIVESTKKHKDQLAHLMRDINPLIRLKETKHEELAA